MEVPPPVAQWARHYKILCVLAVLVFALAIPVYRFNSDQTRAARESVLKNNLYTLRSVIDRYTFDRKKAPQSLQDLVSGGYLREIPTDPMTGSNRTWRTVMEGASPVNQAQPGIFDVKSGSRKLGHGGEPYANW